MLIEAQPHLQVKPEVHDEVSFRVVPIVNVQVVLPTTCHNLLFSSILLYLVFSNSIICYPSLNEKRVIVDDYTRRRFDEHHCGTGVTSRIATTSRPAAASARIADSRPEPGPFNSYFNRFKSVFLSSFLAAFDAIERQMV